MIKGFRFTNQLSNAEIDARIHQEFLNKNDGIFYGMDINNTNNSITISEGLCEIAGRPVAVIGDETIQTSSEDLYCILVLEIDLSKESTSSVFEQVSFKILTSSISYPTVTKQDINIYNGENNIYQLEFARFRTSTAGIKEFKDTRTFLNFKGIYDQIKKECEKIISEIKKELENVENGSRYFLKAQELTNQNLNDYTVEGVYYAQGGNNVLAKPSGVDYFGMTVLRTANGLCTQQLISNQQVYYRHFKGGSEWADWKTVSLVGHKHDVKISGAIKGNTSFDESGNIIINTSQNNVFVLIGTVDLKNGSGSASIKYPTGCNKNNCVPFLSGLNTAGTFYDYGNIQSTCITGVRMTDNDIQFNCGSPDNIGPTGSKNFRVVLMKIS